MDMNYILTLSGQLFVLNTIIQLVVYVPPPTTTSEEALLRHFLELIENIE